MRRTGDSSGRSGGIGFCGALGIAFIVLRLCGVIDWPWVWVLAPIWIPWAVIGAIFLVVLILEIISHSIMHKWTKGE